MTIELYKLPETPPGVLDHLPADVLANLMAAAEQETARASQLIAILHGVMVRRYAQGINGTGTHHRPDGDYDVTITVPKRVEWEQARLASAIEVLRAQGEDPAEYVETKLSVKEGKYNAWPASLQMMFEPARTVKAGKPSFEFRTAKREAA
jgi:hypothetical protein